VHPKKAACSDLEPAEVGVYSYGGERRARTAYQCTDWRSWQGSLLDIARDGAAESVRP
jgi:hypothetical protein